MVGGDADSPVDETAAGTETEGEGMNSLMEPENMRKAVDKFPFERLFRYADLVAESLGDDRDNYMLVSIAAYLLGVHDERQRRAGGCISG